MLNMNRLLKVSSAWISIVYVICFVGVALLPGVRPQFMMYGLHSTGIDAWRNVLTLGTFVSGLVIWNIVVLLGVWLFLVLYNNIKK